MTTTGFVSRRVNNHHHLGVYARFILTQLIGNKNWHCDIFIVFRRKSTESGAEIKAEFSRVKCIRLKKTQNLNDRNLI